MAPKTKTPELPNGPAAAALLAGGIGSAMFGLITFFSEVSASFGKFLNWYNPVGALSGKSTSAFCRFLWLGSFCTMSGRARIPISAASRTLPSAYWLSP